MAWFCFEFYFTDLEMVYWELYYPPWEGFYVIYQCVLQCLNEQYFYFHFYLAIFHPVILEVF